MRSFTSFFVRRWCICQCEKLMNMAWLITVCLFPLSPPPSPLSLSLNHIGPVFDLFRTRDGSVSALGFVCSQKRKEVPLSSFSPSHASHLSSHQPITSELFVSYESQDIHTYDTAPHWLENTWRITSGQVSHESAFPDASPPPPPFFSSFFLVVIICIPILSSFDLSLSLKLFFLHFLQLLLLFSDSQSLLSLNLESTVTTLDNFVMKSMYFSLFLPFLLPSADFLAYIACSHQYWITTHHNGMMALAFAEYLPAFLFSQWCSFLIIFSSLISCSSSEWPPRFTYAALCWPVPSSSSSSSYLSSSTPTWSLEGYAFHTRDNQLSWEHLSATVVPQKDGGSGSGKGISYMNVREKSS